MQDEADIRNKRRVAREAIHRHDAAVAVEQVRSLVAASSKPSDLMFCSSSLASISSEIVSQLNAMRLKVHVVRTVTVEPIQPFLTLHATLSNYVLDLQIGGFGSYADELMNIESALAKFEPDLVLIILDLEDIAGRLPMLCGDGIGEDVDEEIEESAQRIERLLATFRAGSSVKLLFQGLVIPDRTSLGDVGNGTIVNSLPQAVMRLNQKLAAVCRDIADCVFFDVDHIAGRFGRADWRDERMFLASRLAVSVGAFSIYARGLVRCFSTLFRPSRKILCTDLDNTLWGGTLGEDGVEGIATGAAFPGNCYSEYQKYLKQLSSRGILLAAVSKNNEADVREAFKSRSADLSLTLHDFVAIKINWNDKTDSLRQLAKELALGLDSFVMVDDNPAECEAIRKQLPEVAVILAPLQEPWRLVEILSEESLFDVSVVTEDDAVRLKDYKAIEERAELATQAKDRDEFLASLGIVCTFLDAIEAPLSRATQLLAKTNQFNLTTRRHHASVIQDFSASTGGHAVAVRVHDRFGDSGVVGLALSRTRKDVCHIDSFLLSCRVIGRGIESALLAHVSELAIKDGAKVLTAEYIPTSKNAPSADFLSKHGFKKLRRPHTPETGSVWYELDLTTSFSPCPNWITLKGSGSNDQPASSPVSA